MNGWQVNGGWRLLRGPKPPARALRRPPRRDELPSPGSDRSRGERMGSANRPLNAHVRVVPREPTLTRCVVEDADLVEEMRFVVQGTEPVSEAGGHIQHPRRLGQSSNPSHARSRRNRAGRRRPHRRRGPAPRGPASPVLDPPGNEARAPPRREVEWLSWTQRSVMPRAANVRGARLP